VSSEQPREWGPEDVRPNARGGYDLSDAAVAEVMEASFGADATRPVITVDQTEFDALLAVATLYVEAFGNDEAMTLPERMRLQEVEDILAKHGKRY
jgi:hypothetical protein